MHTLPYEVMNLGGGQEEWGGGCGSTCVHMNMSLFCLLGGAALAKVCKKSN